MTDAPSITIAVLTVITFAGQCADAGSTEWFEQTQADTCDGSRLGRPRLVYRWMDYLSDAITQSIKDTTHFLQYLYSLHGCSYLCRTREKNRATRASIIHTKDFPIIIAYNAARIVQDLIREILGLNNNGLTKPPLVLATWSLFSSAFVYFLSDGWISSGSCIFEISSNVRIKL